MNVGAKLHDSRLPLFAPARKIGCLVEWNVEVKDVRKNAQRVEVESCHVEILETKDRAHKRLHLVKVSGSAIDVFDAVLDRSNCRRSERIYALVYLQMPMPTPHRESKPGRVVLRDAVPIDVPTIDVLSIIKRYE